MNNLYEIIKEFTLRVDGFDDTIKARLSMLHQPQFRMQYMWEISHYYKPTADAGVYIPTNHTGNDELDVQNSMMRYLAQFRNIGIVKNENY